MEILYACPANVATGGTELIHDIVSTLDSLDGVNAKILYMGGDQQDPCPQEYREYGCKYVTETTKCDVVIYPEIWANKALTDRACVRAVNWLGVDAYAGHTPVEQRGAFLEDDRILHIAQSAYAEDFLRNLAVKNIYRLSDVLNRAFYEDYEEGQRDDTVLYNPAKATRFTYTLLAELERNGIRSKPIEGMTRQQVIDLMRSSKLYMDFGDFPGRERLPREAVMCGCCIITDKIGAARYTEDFPIPYQYKFERKEGHIFAIVKAVRYVLDNYDACREGFNTFRIILRNERNTLQDQCRELVKVFANEIQHNHSGL